MLASAVRNRLSRNLLVVEHQEIRPENTRTLEGVPLFFRLHAGWWLSSLSESGCVYLCDLQRICERRQIEWRLHTAQVLPEILTTSAWIFLIVRRAGGDLSPFRDECCGRKQHVENLPPYADWVVIGPVGLSKASVTRSEPLSLSVSSVLGEHCSVPRLASVPEFDSECDQPYKPLHDGRFCV